MKNRKKMSFKTGQDNDKPIKSSKEDILERGKFVDQLINSIYSWHDSEKSFVIGLYGKWGEGKTSIINLIKEKITNKQKPDETTLLIIQFNPWEYNETDDLFTPLIKEVISKLKNKNGNRKLIKKLEYYTQLVNCVVPDSEKFWSTISTLLFILFTIGGSFTKFGQQLIKSPVTTIIYCIILCITFF